MKEVILKENVSRIEPMICQSKLIGVSLFNKFTSITKYSCLMSRVVECVINKCVIEDDIILDGRVLISKDKDKIVDRARYCYKSYYYSTHLSDTVIVKKMLLLCDMIFGSDLHIYVDIEQDVITNKSSKQLENIQKELLRQNDKLDKILDILTNK